MFFKKNNTQILDALKLIDAYVKNEINSIEKNDNSMKGDTKEIMETILKLSSLIESKQTEDLTLFGEIMLSTEKLADGYTNDRISIKTSNEKLNYIAKSINVMTDKLDKNLSEISKILKEYSQQKYLNSIDEDLFKGGKLKDLSVGINYLKKEITKNLINSYNTCMTLNEESKSLLKNSTLLFDATSTQAVAIEETSAAIEEINATVISNTNTTKTMSKQGSLLINSVTTGSNLASKTVHAMNDINESTNTMQEATNIIDQIAFQTNILSLNAAVEAATAGEAGKGFAVVAQEVRNLASRSAQAAKDIKDLVEAAKIKATEGKTIADEMISGYKELSENIETTTSLIDEVSKASQEQEKSIEMINDSITQIDTLTQKNASVAQNVKDISNQMNEIVNTNVELVNKAEFEKEQ